MRYLILSLVISLSLIPELTAQSDWIYNPANGHSYKEFVVPGHNWHNAVAEAETLGGYLACISDAAENDWLTANFPPRGGAQDAFLGGTDENQEGVWEWITGEPWTYTNWSPGEPNNGGWDEDYLEWGGSWNDVPASAYGTPFGIVEREEPPEPPLLSTDLFAGQIATIQVSNCTPNRKVYVAYSLTGGGTTWSPFGTLALSAPYYVFRPTRADSSGVAQIDKFIPRGAAGINVWMQAYDVKRKRLSNGLALVIQ